ncbi:hypothetical protein CIY_18620 [Butyrivibrio fibrisolvens 16/4]|nr:hypothetical protein CIY_18620 [Butyrivibrio fibrisolvens 16/4]
MKKNVVKAMSLGLSAVTLAGSINMTALADEITSEEQIENTTENVSENPTETNTEDAADEASKSLSDAVESVGEYNKSVNEDNMGVVEGDLTASEAAREAAKEAAEAGKNASVSEAVKQAEKAADAVATAEAVKVQAEEKVENAQDACNEAKASLDNARAELNKLLAKNGINVDHKEDYSEDMQAAIDSAQKVLNDAQLAYDSAVSELSDAEARLNSAELELAAKEQACKNAEEALANANALKAGAEYAKGVYTTNYEAATKFLREAQAKQIDNANKLNKLNGEYTDAVEANEKIDFNENDLSQAEIDLGKAEKDFESADSLNNYVNQIDESINNLSRVRSKDNNTKIAKKLIEYYVYQSLDNKADFNPALLKMKSNFSSPEWERHYIEVWYNNQFQGYFNFETLDKNGNHVSGVNFFGLGSVYERDTHQVSIIKKSSAWSYGGDVVLYEKSGLINSVEKSYTSEKEAAKNALSDAKIKEQPSENSGNINSGKIRQRSC